MRRPSATKALKTLSLRITTWMFCFSRPAVRRIGRVYSRSSCSASVSRMIGGPFSCCASSGGIGAMVRATAVVTAGRLDVMAAAARIEAAGGHVIHMEVGQPAAPAPKAAIAAAHAALDGGRIDYTSALGTPSLRARIARHYREIYGCVVDAERIVVTTGSSGAFILGFLAMFEPGDRVAVTVPGYPPYRHILPPLT